MSLERMPPIAHRIVLTPLAFPKPGNGKRSGEIKDLYKGFSLSHMKDFLKEFTGFRTRYYRSDTGRQSQKFLLSTIKEVSQV